MNNHIAYINDDYVQIKTKNIIIIKSNAIKNGIIINKKKFIEDYKKIIKNKNILSPSITILLNKKINDQDTIYYTNIFEELNYNIINIISTEQYLDNNVLIPNNKYYILYINNNYYYLYPFLLEEFIKYLNINKLKIISNIELKIGNYCKCYYYANSQNYFMQ